MDWNALRKAIHELLMRYQYEHDDIGKACEDIVSVLDAERDYYDRVRRLVVKN